MAEVQRFSFGNIVLEWEYYSCNSCWDYKLRLFAADAFNPIPKLNSSDLILVRKKYAELITVRADIKTAYRCSRMKKQRSFIETAICGSSELDKDSLVRASLGGTEGLFSYLESTSYGDAARMLADSPAKFEKWSDDVIMDLAETARMEAFGADPLAAYFIAAEAELKNLRIISVCKESGTDRETITERMRKLYV